MRPGAEYLTSNAQIAFPLSEDQNVPDYVKGFLVDAYFVTSSTETEFTLQGISGSQSSFTVTVKPSNGDAVSLSYAATLPAQKYAVLRSQDKSICLVVIPSAFKQTYMGSLKFCQSVVEANPAHVTSIQLWDGLGMYAEKIAEVTGDVKFSNGYSTTVTASGNEVTIAAVPGAGKGLYPCEDCPEPSGSSGSEVIDVGDPIQTDSGIIRFENDACFDIIPFHTSQMQDLPGIQIINKCVACCQCSQYAGKVGVLKDLASIVSQAGKNVIKAINKLNGEINAYNARGHKHVLGADQTGWEITVTGIRKDPSVGDVKGLTRVRGVVGVSNRTASASQVQLTTFKAEPAATTHALGDGNENSEESEEEDGKFEDVQYFTSADTDNSGKGDTVESLGSGMAAKFTGVAKLDVAEDDDVVITVTVTTSSGSITRTTTC